MAVSVNGDRELDFIATLDTSQFRKEITVIEAAIARVNKQTTGFTGAKPDTAAIAKYRSEIQRLESELIKLNNIGGAGANVFDVPALESSGQKARKTFDATTASVNQVREKISDLKVQFNALERGTDDYAAKSARLSGNISKLTALEKELTATYKERARTATTKSKTVISDSAAEVEAYKKSAAGNKEVTSALTAEQKARNEAAASSSTYISGVEKSTKATAANVAQTKAAAVSIELLREKQIAYRAIAEGSTNPTVVAKYNAKLQETEQQIARLSNVGRKGFDDIGDKIGKSGNLAQKLFSGLRNIAYILPGIGIAGLLAFAIDPIVKAVQSLTLFTKKLNEVVEIRKILNGVELSGAQSSQEEITRLTTLRKVVEDVTKPLSLRLEYTKELQRIYPDYFTKQNQEATLAGKTAEKYDLLTASIIATARARAAEGKITENASRQLEDEQKLLDLQIEREKIQTKLNEVTAASNRTGAGVNDTGGAGLRGRIAGFEEAIKNNLKQQSDLKKDIDILDNRNLKLRTNINEQIKKGADLTEGEKDNSGKEAKAAEVAENRYQRALEKRLDVINKIGSENADVNAKAKSAIDQEIDANIQKFKELRDGIQEFNRFASKFNSSNKNQLQLIDETQLDPIEAKAKANIISKIEVEEAKINIEQQKAIYTEYEDFRFSYGKQQADARYSEELKGYKTYVDFIIGEQARLSSLSDPTSLALLDFYTKELPKAQQTARKKTFDETTKLLGESLKASENARIKELAINEKYDRQLAALRDSGIDSDELSERERVLGESRQKELLEVKKLAFEESQFYKDAMVDVTNYSIAELKRRIKEAKKELLDAALTAEERKALQGKLDAAENSAAAKGVRLDDYGQFVNKNNATTQQADKVAAYAQAAQQSFAEIAASLTDINPGLADTFRTLSDIAGVAGSAAKSVAGFASGDIVGGITNAISTITGIFNIFGQARESARKASQEIANFQYGLVQGELELSRVMRERARSQEDINALTNIEVNARRELLKLQQQQSGNDFEKQLADLQKAGQQVIDTVTEKYGGVLGIGRKTRTKEITAGLQGLTFEQIEALSIAGKLNDATEIWFQNLKKNKDEYEQIKDAERELAELVTTRLTGGVTADSISSSIVQGFKDGKRAVTDFADDVQDIISNALLSAISYNLLSQPLADLVEQLGTDSQNGLDLAEIEKFKTGYDIATQTFIDAASAIEKATGVTLSKLQDTSSNSLSGAIQRGITEETGTLIAGQFNGLRLIAIDQLGVARSSLTAAEQTAANTFRIAENSDLLRSIDSKLSGNGNMLAAAGIR